jgi:hypothetical protein
VTGKKHIIENKQFSIATTTDLMTYAVSSNAVQNRQMEILYNINRNY